MLRSTGCTVRSRRNMNQRRDNVDHTKQPPTVLSVCTGYGGIERGLSWVIGDVTPLAYVEVEAFACQNLVQKMETGEMAAAPIWSDVKTFPVFGFHGCVDILLGGYPCQPFSNAGARLDYTDDPRHLWPYIRRIIRVTQPKLCFFENVEGHINRGLGQVLEDLEAEGYRTTWGLFSAEETGAPHVRKRVFIMGDKGFEWQHYMADADRRLRESAEPAVCTGGNVVDRSSAVADADCAREHQQTRCGCEERDGVKHCGEDVAHACCSGLEGHPGDEQATGSPGAGPDRPPAAGGISLRWPARPMQPQFEWEEPRLVTKFKRGGQ